VPETYLTVWANLIERGRLRAGETVLIHGGSSGIGITAIHLAKWVGAIVITTVGNEEKMRIFNESEHGVDSVRISLINDFEGRPVK
jgi:NADPH:quinone reductase-like Zn-dependent oxidoreductase